VTVTWSVLVEDMTPSFADHFHRMQVSSHLDRAGGPAAGECGLLAVLAALTAAYVAVNEAAKRATRRSLWV
jgi:hypothetical protein